MNRNPSFAPSETAIFMSNLRQMSTEAVYADTLALFPASL
jgi:hypothetical protein